MRQQLCFAVVLAGTVVATQAQSAQRPPQAQQTRPGQQGAPATPNDPADTPSLTQQQLINHLDAFMIVQAQQQLGIPDDKFGTFAARLKNVQDLRRRYQRERRLALVEFRRLMKSPQGAQVDDAFKKQLDAMRDNEERSAAELRQAYAALDEMLNLQQQARLRLLEEEIEWRKLELTARARERTRGGKQ